MRKTWTVDIEERQHTIELLQGYWNARRTIAIDDRVVRDIKPSLDTSRISTEERFTIEGHRVALRVRPRIFSYEAELVIDGLSVDTHEPAGPLAPATAGKGQTLPTPGVRRLGVVMYAGLAVVLLLFGLVPGYRDFRFDVEPVALVTGRVIDLSTVSGRYGPTYYASYTYLVGSRSYRTREHVWEGPWRALTVGSPVLVEVIQSDPGTSRIRNGREPYREAIVFLILADAQLASLLFVLLAAARSQRRVARIARDGTAVQGVVTAFERTGNIFRLRYEYRDANGEVHVGRTGPVDGHRAFSMWDGLPIKYDPAHPHWSVASADV